MPLPGGRRAGPLGPGREFPLVRAGGGAQLGGDRAGAATRLGRRPGGRGRLSDAGRLADLAGRTGGGGTLAHGGGTGPPVRGRAAGPDAAPSGPGLSRDRPRPDRGGAVGPARRGAPAWASAGRSAPAHLRGTRVPGARPRTAGGDRTGQRGPDRDERRGTRTARHPHRGGGAAARAGQPAGGDGRARAPPRPPGRATPSGVADIGLSGRGERPGRTRRAGGGRTRPRARARSGRARWPAPSVPAAPAAGVARTPCPAGHGAPRIDQEHHHRAGRPEPSRARRHPAGARTRAGAGTAIRAAQPGRGPRPVVPANQPLRAGDRPRALRVGEHGPDAHPAPIRQARRPPPPGGHRPGPRRRTARTRPAASVSPSSLLFTGHSGRGLLVRAFNFVHPGGQHDPDRQ
jgi:hypothetical protein